MRRRNLIYIAGPLYTPSERQYLEEIAKICHDIGFKTYLPHRDGGLAPASGKITKPYYETDVLALNKCVIVVAILNGYDVDSGTAWEMGYAFAQKRKILGFYEDTRIYDEYASLNLMISSTVELFKTRKELKEKLINLKAETFLPNNYSDFYSIDKDTINKLELEVQKIVIELADVSPDNFGHETTALCCIDAVLSINRNYKKFVVPRLEHFRRNFSEIKGLLDLKKMLNSMKSEIFAKDVIKYKDINRVFLLNRVVDKLLEKSQYQNDVNNELRLLKHWAESVDADEKLYFDVNGIGLATFQYIRMLFGANTIKPDVHIKRFIQDATKKKMSDYMIISLLENIAKKINIDPLVLDHTIWRKYSKQDNIKQNEMFS